MELRHLRYFLTVCEEMNFTKAAEKLMIAQPPLSRQIKDLEEEIGAPLFVRGHHSLELTEEGEMLKQYAGRILGLADMAVEDIRQMHDGLQGTVYLAGVEGKAPHIISQWIKGFSALYPEVEYSLWNGNSDDVAGRIKKGLSDVAVIMEPFDPEGLHCIPVYEEPWYAIFSTEHPLAALPGNNVDLIALADCELIIPSKDSRLGEINDWFAPYHKTARVKAKIANVLNVYELCRNNIGVAIFPAATADIVKDENLQIRKIVNPEFTAKYVAVYSAEHTLPPVANKFVEYLNSLQTKDGIV